MHHPTHNGLHSLVDAVNDSNYDFRDTFSFSRVNERSHHPPSTPQHSSTILPPASSIFSTSSSTPTYSSILPSSRYPGFHTTSSRHTISPRYSPPRSPLITASPERYVSPPKQFEYSEDYHVSQRSECHEPRHTLSNRSHLSHLNHHLLLHHHHHNKFHQHPHKVQLCHHLHLMISLLLHLLVFLLLLVCVIYVVNILQKLSMLIGLNVMSNNAVNKEYVFIYIFVMYLNTYLFICK